MAFFVIGGEELVVGFRFVGVPGVVVRSSDEALAAFRSATADKAIKVLIITEQAAALITHEVMEWQLGGAYPLIVEIPDVEGHLQGRTSLIDSIREAVGLHV